VKNSLFVISPYKWYGMWVFDDPSVELEREPFVSGIPEMIDELTKDIPNAEKGFLMTFSENRFPDHQIVLEKNVEEDGGTWYTLGDSKGWLCPALLKYFPEAPEQIYIKIHSRS